MQIIITIRKRNIELTVLIDSFKVFIQINSIRSIIILIEINLRHTLSLSFLSKSFHISLKMLINTMSKINRTFRSTIRNLLLKRSQNSICNLIFKEFFSSLLHFHQIRQSKKPIMRQTTTMKMRIITNKRMRITISKMHKKIIMKTSFKTKKSHTMKKMIFRKTFLWIRLSSLTYHTIAKNAIAIFFSRMLFTSILKSVWRSLQ